MSYEEGEGYVLGPSPIDAALAIRFLELFAWLSAIVVLTALSFTVGYRAGHNAATAAIHKESS